MTPAIERLVKQLRDSDAAYYNDGTSTLSDKEYDRLKDLLRKLDPSNEYLKEIAGESNAIITEWEKVKHDYPLGSLNKCNTYSEFEMWWDGRPVLLQEKLDGISIALTYKKGKLVSAVTRGDGEQGDEIYSNVKKMNGLPKTIIDNSTLVIRGEILLKHSKWLAMPIESRGKNPRNTAAGAAKELNGSKCQQLNVVVYSILNSDDTNELSDIQKLNTLGFEVVPFYSVSTANQANIMYKNYISEIREKIDYDIDGLVIKPVIKRKDEWKYPKHQIAWKFPHQSAETYLTDVVWQVSGDRVTPVAIFDSVDVAGVSISRASLHNMDYINGLKICIGDKIEITRRNDVIPQVERVLNHCGAKNIKQPSKCPCCGGDVAFDKNVNEDNMAWLVCMNPSCSAKVLKDIMKWLDVNDTKGIAEKTIELLFEHKVFLTLNDFIGLANTSPSKEKTILSIDGMGESKFQTLKEQISKTINCDLITFFGGLNAPGFGRRMWERIIKYIQIERDTVCVSDVIGFIVIPYEKGLGHIEGFAETNTKELQKYVESHLNYIIDLAALVKPQEYSKPSLTSETLKGKSFCFTGELSSMGRKDAQDAVLRNGGEVKSSVTKGLTYLVTNDPSSGSTKNKKAQQVGTAIIGEPEFLKLIK